MKDNPELDAIKIINKLILTLDYLELVSLEDSIYSRRQNMRDAAKVTFKSIEEVK